MTHLLVCVLCGRQGPKDFVVLSGTPPTGDGRPLWRCGNGDACQRRQQQAADVGGAAPSGDESSGYASATAVAGLAREVEAVRRAVDPLAALPAQVDELARVVTHLAEEVAATTRRPPAHAPSWLDLPGDVRVATALLRDLVDWMGEVYLRYADAVQFLPACWLWHADVVEELLWLMHAWLAAYRDEDAPVSLAGDWHDRYRPGVVRRIRTLAGSCSLENHQPGHGQRSGRPVVPIGEAMAPLATWWARHRDQAPPEPTESQMAAAAALPRRGGRR